VRDPWHPVFVMANRNAERSAPLTVLRLAGAICDALRPR
jgi:hypothetical protein